MGRLDLLILITFRLEFLATPTLPFDRKEAEEIQERMRETVETQFNQGFFHKKSTRGDAL